MGYKVFPVAASGLHAPVSVFAPRPRKPASPLRIDTATPPRAQIKDFRAYADDEHEGGHHQPRSVSGKRSKNFR